MFLKGGTYNCSFCANDCCLIGGEKIILPCDVRVISTLGKSRIKKISQVKRTDEILDIGPETIKLFSEILSQAKTIFWNGPMGFIEDENFALGTQKIAEVILKSKAQVIIGGGETISSLRSVVSEDWSSEKVFLSTGGGAMLEFLAGKELVGLKVLLE